MDKDYIARLGLSHLLNPKLIRLGIGHCLDKPLTIIVIINSSSYIILPDLCIIII